MAADINHNYENLQESYLFAETAKRVNAYSHSHRRQNSSGWGSET